jgi:diguanylate cyclase (GGDEF)-like protein
MKSLRRGRAELFARQTSGRASPHAASTNGRVADGTDVVPGEPDAALARRIVERAPVLIFAVDADGVITLSHGGLVASWGLRNGETVGLHMDAVYPDAPDFRDRFMQALTGREGREVVRVGARTVDVWYGPRHDATGAVIGVLGLVSEICDADRATALQTRQTAVLLRILHGASLEESLQAVVNLVEAVTQDVHCDLLVPDPLVPPVDTDARWSVPIVTEAGATVGCIVGRPQAPRPPTGNEHDMLALGAQLAGIAVERDRGRERLANAVVRDPLTGLLCRSQLLQTLDQMVRERRAPALLFCSLDRFKLINDSLGFGFGDRVLAAVAARMRSTVRGAGVVARVGGDEFVVLLDGMTDSAQVEQMARRILSRVIAPMSIDGRSLLPTLSMGVALPDAADSAADLLRRGDAAMSQAKRRGRERYVVARRSTDSNTALRRLELESGIRAALEHDELRLHFQPVVRCDNRRVALVEALVRWDHPDHGLVPPGVFLPVAEDAGLLSAIDRWVVSDACRQVVGCAGRDTVIPPVVSVNLAGLPFDAVQIVPRILDDARDAGLMPQQLIIEVTENLLGAEEGRAVAAFERLRARGVRIAIDDFGTGYSSLNRLKSLPVDLLKVDRSFVEGLGEEPEASALLDAIVTMGHALGMEIIAEGVETATQFAEVCRLGCDMAQGYHLARPAPLDELRLARGHGAVGADAD